MVKLCILALLSLVAMFGFVSAQSPDSLILTNSEAGPGDTTVVQLFLRNTQFSVNGFTSRFILEDYQNATFSHVERGEAVIDFEMFFANVTRCLASSCLYTAATCFGSLLLAIFSIPEYTWK